MTTPLVPWYTSNTLIEAIKRKCAVPLNQRTFEKEDILALANEVMLSSMVPSIKMVHDNYYAQVVKVPLIDNVARYPIPDRSIGMGLQDVFFEDSGGNLYEMTQIQAGDRAQYQRASGVNVTPHKFYTEGNDIVLLPATAQASSGQVVFVIYVRPNQLVVDERAAIFSNQFIKEVRVDNNLLVTTDTLTVLGNTFPASVGSTSGHSAILMSSLINGSVTNLTATPVSDTIVLTYNNRQLTTVANTNGGFSVSPNISITCTLPIDTTIYSVGSYIDFLQTKPGHKIYNWDLQIVGINGSVVTFVDADVPSTLIVGDYMCLANECIIPYMPSELHNILAEKTAASILEALGDVEGLKTAMTKIQDLETKQNFLIDNRVENAPFKVVNKYSLLRLGKMGSFRRF